MIKASILKEMEQLVPKGEWSGFVNTAIEEAMTKFSKKTAGGKLAEFRKNNSKKLSDEDIYKTIREGRRD